jgi:hypothetical protein
MFFFGQLVSSSLRATINILIHANGKKKAYLVISLASTIRFSSFTTNGPTHTDNTFRTMTFEAAVKYPLSLRMRLSFR